MLHNVAKRYKVMKESQKQTELVILQEEKPQKKRLVMRLSPSVDMTKEQDLVKKIKRLQRELGHKAIIQTLLFTARIYFKNEEMP